MIDSMILCEIVNGIGYIWILWLEKVNVLIEFMLVVLVDGFWVMVDVFDLWVVILIGMGWVFFVGVDLDVVCVGLVLLLEWEWLFGVVVVMFCLIIVVLNGMVVGGVMGMVLVCDIRLVVFEVKFFYLVMWLGYLL